MQRRPMYSQSMRSLLLYIQIRFTVKCYDTISETFTGIMNALAVEEYGEHDLPIPCSKHTDCKRMRRICSGVLATDGKYVWEPSN
jgi:hypothetical protein